MSTETRNEAAPRTAAGRDFVHTLRGWFIDPDGTFDEDAIAVWTGDILAIEAETRRATVERIRNSVLHREKEYMWTWDADTWTEADIGHSAEMIGDFLGILDEEAAR